MPRLTRPDAAPDDPADRLELTTACQPVRPRPDAFRSLAKLALRVAGEQLALRDGTPPAESEFGVAG